MCVQLTVLAAIHDQVLGQKNIHTLKFVLEVQSWIHHAMGSCGCLCALATSMTKVFYIDVIFTSQLLKLTILCENNSL